MALETLQGVTRMTQFAVPQPVVSSAGKSQKMGSSGHIAAADAGARVQVRIINTVKDFL